VTRASLPDHRAGHGAGTRVVAEGRIVAAALLPLAARRPVVYRAHNLESAFGHRLEDAGLTKKQLERFERLVLERFAESWMVSDAEMDGARALVPWARAASRPERAGRGRDRAAAAARRRAHHSLPR
jgi:hypothetical protein